MTEQDPTPGSPRRSRRAALLLAAVTAVVLVAPAGAAEPVAEPVAAFSWQSPRSLTGPVALRMVVDFGAEQQCTFRVQTAGTTRRPPILMWEEANGRPAAFFSSYTAQAHGSVAGQTADTRTLVAPGGAWSYDGTAETTFSGRLDYRLVVADAGYWANASTGEHPAVRLDLTCARPVSVGGFATGREAVVFKADSLAGGTGASVYQPLGGSVNTNAGDGLSAPFTGEVVRLRVTDSTITSQVEGTLTVRAPGGTTTHALDGSDDVAVEGGPGTWGLTLDRRAAGYSDQLLGVVYALTPAASLPEALGGR